MKPRPLWFALLLATMLAVLGWAAACVHAPGLGHAFKRAAYGSLALLDRAGGVAEAQEREVLEFKPVPAESVSAFERQRDRASRRGESAPPAPPTPPASSTPPAPSTPLPAPPAPPAPGKSGNITRIGSDIFIGEDQVVVGDVVAVGGDVTVEGHVEGDVASMGGDVFLKSTARIDGDVVCMGGRLDEEPGASVGGQRVSGLGGGRDIRIAPFERERHPFVDRSARIASSIAWLLILLGFAWAYTRLGPGRTAAAVETLEREPGASLGIGALVFALIAPSVVALALVVAILCITIIGIPVALAALMGYVLFLALMFSWGFVVAAAALGRVLFARAAPALASPTAPAAPAPSLTRAAVIGVLALVGLGIAGRILQAIGFVAPIHGFGTLFVVLSRIAFLLAMTVGAGAWLRTEMRAGTIARWWRGSQWGRANGKGASAAAVPPSGGSPPPNVPTPPVSSPPPSVPPPPSPGFSAPDAGPVGYSGGSEPVA